MRLLTVVILALAAAAPARADWSAPVTVAQETTGREFGQLFTDVQVGVDDAGNGVVVWSRESGGERFQKPRIFAADVRSDGTVGAPQRISPPGENAYTPRLNVAPDGSAAVLFDTGAPRSTSPQLPPPGPRPVRIVTRAPAGDWSPARKLSTGGRNFTGDVVIEPSGTVVAAWKHLHGRKPYVGLARVTGDRITRSRLPAGTTKPRLAASAAFPHAVLAYLVNKHNVNGGPRELHLRVNGQDRVLDEREDRQAPALSVDEHLTIAWGWYTLDDAVPLDQRNGLRVARLEPGADEPVVQGFDTGTGGVGGATAATSGTTDALAWAYGFGTHVSRSDDGAPFPAGADPSPTTEDSGATTATGAGRVVTLWQVPSHHVGGREALMAATSEPGAALGAPVDLLAPDESMNAPGLDALAMNHAGVAMAAYRVSTVGQLDLFGATLKVVVQR